MNNRTKSSGMVKEVEKIIIANYTTLNITLIVGKGTKLL